MAAAKREREVEDAVLGVCRKLPNGASTENLRLELAQIPQDQMMVAINSLMSKNRIKLFQTKPEPGQPGGTAIFKEVNAEDAAKYKGLNTEELMLYQAIKAADNMGMWTKEMKFKTNLAQPQITKILKVLEGRKLIKAVKNVNNPSRKVYMVSEVEPSRELTGGAWYSDNQFDAEFIEVLRESCYKFIAAEEEPVTLREIAAFISKRGFSKVELRQEDVDTIVQTLLYDGRIDNVEVNDEEKYRPAVLQLPIDTPLTSMPCGVCPVFNECRDGGVISPQTCVYYDEWLKFAA